MNILNELNNFKIEDLAKVDYLKILEQLRKRPDILISAGAILLAILSLFFSFGQSKKQFILLAADRSLLERKLSQINKYNQTKSDFDSYVSQVPPALNESDFVSYVTDLANKEHIQIVSLNPARLFSSPYYDSAQIDLVLSVPDYQTVFRFIYALEHAKYAIRIDSWSGGLATGEKSQNVEEGANEGKSKNLINSRVSLTAVSVKKS